MIDLNRSYYLKMYEELTKEEIVNAASYEEFCTFMTNTVFSEENMNAEEPTVKEYITLYKSRDVVLDEIKHMLKESMEGVQLNELRFLYLCGLFFHIDSCILLLADAEKFAKFVDTEKYRNNDDKAELHRYTIDAIGNAVIANLIDICKSYSIDIIDDIIMRFYSSGEDFINYMCKFLGYEFTGRKVTQGVFYILVNLSFICVNTIRFKLIDDIGDEDKIHEIVNELCMRNRYKEEYPEYTKFIPLFKNVNDALNLIIALNQVSENDVSKISDVIEAVTRRSCTVKDNIPIVERLLGTIYKVVNE